MKRRLLNLLTALSLLLCVVVAGLWVRSYSGASYRAVSAPHSYPADVLYDYDVLSVESSRGVLKFRIELVHHSALAGHVPSGAPRVTVPYWFIALLCAVLPTVWLVLKGRRRTPGSSPRVGTTRGEQ